jgi:NADH dehydrogenase [ubiquinone] 1 alpha subcomplex assembly factor 2
MQEQHADLGRQAQLKYLAQQADERWASKPSFLDKPRGQPKPATMPKDPGGYAVQTEPDEKEGARSAVDTPPVEPEPPKSAKRADLRKQAGSGGPSERWQPESWTPGSAKER